MTKAIRRLVLEQFGYIDVELELDLTLSEEEAYEKARTIERNLDAYKSAFWDLMKEKKAERLDQRAQEEKQSEAQRIEELKDKVVKLIESDPEAIKAKIAEFGGMIDENAAAALILKESESPPESTTTKQAAAPALPDTMTFFKSKFGWSLYTDISALDDILGWLVSVPKDKRHRKTAEPKKSNNSKAIYVNDAEKKIIEDEAKRQGKTTFEKDE